ncbi:TPA: hypothetical protein N0F65_005257, partial [Lagenidium giganteum]
MLKALTKKATAASKKKAPAPSSSSEDSTDARRTKTAKSKRSSKAKATAAASSSSQSSDARNKSDTSDAAPVKRPQKRAISIKAGGSSGKMKRTPLLDYHIIEAVYSAMSGKELRKARLQVVKLFSGYDSDDQGVVPAATFRKCLKKLGVVLETEADYKALMTCFRKPTGKERVQGEPPVDYMWFAEFACNVRDSERLSTLARRMRKRLRKWDATYDMHKHLQKLDKNKQTWIAPTQFTRFLEREEFRFQLEERDLDDLVERFEYDYGPNERGIDYEQFAHWVQPRLHLDVTKLHGRVQELVMRAQEECGWALGEVFEAMDEDGDGEISANELKNALIEMGLPLTDTELQCLVDEYDVDGDGSIQYKEFMTLFPDVSKKAKKKTKKAQKTDTDSETSEPTLKNKAKTKTTGKKNVRNTFSWGIAKAFARKQQAQQNKNSAKNKGDKKKTDGASSSESDAASSRDDKKSKKTASKPQKTKKGEISDSEESSSSGDARKAKTKRKASKQVESSSESDSSDGPPRRKQPAKRAQSSSSENQAMSSASETAKRKQSKRKQSKCSGKKKKKKTRHTIEQDSQSTATTTTDKPAPRKRSAAAMHAKSPTRSRSRLASTASTKRRTSTALREPRSTRKRASSSQTPRAKSRHRRKPEESAMSDNQNDSVVASSDASDNMSGLDINDLRRIKKSKPKGGRKHSAGSEIEEDETDNNGGASEEGPDVDVKSRSDVEYEKHLKRSLRRAFDFFDLDQNETIDKRELSHVLRALGHEFTTEELDAALEKADADRNGQLDFHEFYHFVKQQLRQKAFVLTKQRELEIRKSFESLDTDQNGVLDEREFEYLVYKVLQIELSVEEQDALLDFVYTNGDGTISQDEFIQFMKAMEDFRRRMQKPKYRHVKLDSMSALAFSAMKKLVRGAPIDLDQNLSMFFGIPSNFRPAITSFAVCRQLKCNTMEYVLSFPSPQATIGLTQTSDEQRITQVLSDKSKKAADPSEKETSAELLQLLHQVESQQFQAIVSLKRATGVPKPFDMRDQDVHKRCVHVCLYQEPLDPVVGAKAEMKHPFKHGNGMVIGNIHEVPVHWTPNEE